MIGGILKKVFGSKNDREVKRLSPIVEKINALEPSMQALSDGDFKGFTEELRVRLSGGESLDDVLAEAFAAVREVSQRTLKMRHFDEQLIGGLVLHEGKIAEMKTGEGKTLMATLPLYLNAVSGKGAHLITVNDYLARRDSRWMAPVYEALGLSVGIIQHEASFLYDPAVESKDRSFNELRPVSRKEAYLADITYGTNNEYGFDYLRDNMKFTLDEYVQRELHYAIVDEVDSILIDEARTPLIISGPTEDSTEKYYTIDKIIPSLKEEHYTIDEKSKQAFLTDDGVTKVEELLSIENLFDPKHLETLHHVNQALRAHVLFTVDVDYVVNDGEVIIVDEFTGRLMGGRRWSDGLHQAVEAKEKVNIENENQTLASITFQNYFRMYEKLAGMTGTAATEAVEFGSIYKLEVVVVPTHKPMIRDDKTDLVYKTKKEKFNAVLAEIRELNEIGRPVLVGTISIDDSEKLSAFLKKNDVKHHVLNAKHHEKEAEIVAQAGRLGAVTLSTNMAGRGTDIVLGGNPEFLVEERKSKDKKKLSYEDALAEAENICAEEKKQVLELGGLHILGTERHESRRIDNQLRGRSGRQGDPGSSRFYLALDDDIMRIFGSDKIAMIMDKLGMEEGVPIEHSIVSKAVENAQRKVEGHNFDIRKHLLEYDDVMNQQRQVIYDYRRQILAEDGLREMIKDFSAEATESLIQTHIAEKEIPADWDLQALSEVFAKQFGISFDPEFALSTGDRRGLIEGLTEKSWEVYEHRVREIGDEIFVNLERVLLLHTLDNIWKDHLLVMDHLKSGIGLRGYGQKNPLNEYKKEGYELFYDLIGRFKSEGCERLYRVRVESKEEVDDLDLISRKEQNLTLGRGEEADGFGGGEGSEEKKQAPLRRQESKVGRNDPCSCGSGKKFKKCCGQ